MNPQDIPPATRKKIYIVFGLIGLAIGAVGVAYAAVDAGTPDWLKAVLAVYGFLGTGIGYTASSNVPVAPAPPETPEVVTPDA